MRHSGLTLAAAALAVTLAACGKPETAAPSGGASEAPAPAAELTAEDEAALLASLLAAYNTADLANGEAKFALCRSCHTIAEGGVNMTGPNLHGVFGRKAAALESYKYSEPLQKAGWLWDAEHLDQWLANPKTYLPGNKMTFAGLKDAKDRVDLIAFLKVETGYKP